MQSGFFFLERFKTVYPCYLFIIFQSLIFYQLLNFKDQNCSDSEIRKSDLEEYHKRKEMESGRVREVSMH